MKRAFLLAVLVFGIVCLVGAQESPSSLRGNRPAGTWEQTAGDKKITLTIAVDRLHITATTGKDNKPLWLLDADYSVTKDSILYGIVTSVEGEKKMMATASTPAPTPRSSTPPFPEPASSLTIVPPLGLCVDDLFSFRFRVDEDILTIKEVKAKGEGGRNEFVLQGRFKKMGERDDTRHFKKLRDKQPDKEGELKKSLER